MMCLPPGAAPRDDIIRSPQVWHFNFRGPDVERLVKGRERIYLDCFYNQLSANPKAIDEATRRHYAALYARPRAIRPAVDQLAAFAPDGSTTSASYRRASSPCPFWRLEPENPSARWWPTIRASSPPTWHRLMEEQPRATVAVISGFLRKPSDETAKPGLSTTTH